MDKKKVLFFMDSAVGGGQRMTVTIAKMLPLEEYEVKFIIVDKGLGEIMNFIPTGYEVRLLKVRNMWDFMTFRMIRLLKEERPSCVFSTAMHINSRLTLAAGHVGNIKIILRNCNYMSSIRWDKMALIRLSYKKADYIIAQQKEMEDEILSVLSLNPKKVITLQNPIDVTTIDIKSKAASPFPSGNTINYVWVARINPTKGQDVLAKAFVRVVQTEPRARLFFVGRSDKADSYKAYVERIIKDGGCEDKCTFVGFDPNPYRWIKHCDCFVMPSRLEGLPNALVEAQYLGKPCVATTCIPVVERIIEEGVNGFLVNTNDDKAMADAMLKAIQLGSIKMTYKPSDKNDFISLFK